MVSALVAWLVLVFVARAAGPDSYREFVVIWSVYFALAGVLIGLQQQVTRARVLGVGYAIQAWVICAFMGAAGAVLFIAVIGVTSIRQGMTLAAVAILGLVLLGVAMVIVGELSADRRWQTVARLGVADQLVRLVVVIVVIETAPNPTALVAAVFSGLVCYLPWLRRDRVSSGSPLFVRQAGAAMTATGCANLLVVGLPLLVSITGSVPTTTGAALYAAIFLTRSPILVPANALRPWALRTLLDHRETLVRWTFVRFLPMLFGLLAIAVLIGWTAGPWLLRIIFGDDYDLHGAAIGGLAGAAVVLLALVLTGLALVAVGLDKWSTCGWVVATAVTVALLALPIGLVLRCVLAIFFGPAVGLFIHLVALSRPVADGSAGRRPPTSGQTALGLE